MQLFATWLVTSQASGLRGLSLGLWITGVTVALLTPVVFIVALLASRDTIRQLSQSLARERELRDEACRREFETRLTNALEMADTESRVMNVAGRALGKLARDQRAEVLLADNSHAHLHPALVSGPDTPGAGCAVESPDQCVAARRGQTQTFDDSDALDACPYLQDRPIGRCSAVCVPVSIMGRTVGIVHHVGSPAVCDDTTTAQLEVLSNSLGARLGMLRVIGESQLQANTDGLTGLLNRRAFENQLRQRRLAGSNYCLVMADLDHFKQLNDTQGHETGDRALRAYAAVLRDQLRPNDVLCRHGGEEFALALADTTTDEALATCERLREALVLATHAGNLPQFSASYGVAVWSHGQTFEQTLGYADTALYRAKRNGGGGAVSFTEDPHEVSKGRER
ncbi:MAG TPA: GGDEF domain-containing protein [Acidimicrobiales bacterium]|nr:GGDEF domain-containing protein [Acidimicrobiales bacterium]